MREIRWRGALVGGAVFAGALAGCTGAESSTRIALHTDEAVAGETSAVGSGSPGPVEGDVRTGRVSCDVDTCTLTLPATGPRELRALGTTVSLDGIEDGVAGLTVGDGKLECAAGEAVHAGPLTLFCDDVTARGVVLTAEVG